MSPFGRSGISQVTECPQTSSKGLKPRDSWKASLKQTVACGPHHPNLFDCLNKMFSSYILRSGEIFKELRENQGAMH